MQGWKEMAFFSGLHKTQDQVGRRESGEDGAEADEFAASCLAQRRTLPTERALVKSEPSIGY